MATALVTGTSSGIGLATAVALARSGHVVAATMRNLERAGELRKIAAEEQLAIDIEALDVDDDNSVRVAFAAVAARHGPIDILVKQCWHPGRRRDRGDADRVFPRSDGDQLFGVLRCIKEVIPGMRQRRRGTIVNVTSVAGRNATAPLANYAASKRQKEGRSQRHADDDGRN